MWEVCCGNYRQTGITIEDKNCSWHPVYSQTKLYLILQIFWLIGLTCEFWSINLPTNFYSYLPMNTGSNYRSYRKEAKKLPSGQNRKRFLQRENSFFLTSSTLSTAHRLFSGMINFILNFFLFLERESRISVSVICIVVGNAYGNTEFLLSQSRGGLPFITQAQFKPGNMEFNKACGRKLLDTSFSMLINIHSLIFLWLEKV